MAVVTIISLYLPLLDDCALCVSKLPVFLCSLHQTPLPPGFGLYNWFHTLVTGAVVVSFACVAYSNTIIVPTSACELGSTSTQQGLMASVPMIGK